MKTAFLSRFTPSLMPQELLETIFVQRERLAQRTVEHLRESVITNSKSYTLLVGQRGIGKTHLVSLIYHRLRKMDDLQSKMLIAWLREEEWGLSSFLDLLLRILRALSEENGGLKPGMEALYKHKAAEAERMACKLLLETLNGRTLVLIAENLDDLFDGLGDEGQKSFRAFIQETRSITILATVQGLFNAISLQTSPFYGFFQIRHLPGLDIEDARTLLIKIAEIEQDTELAAYLQTPAGKARVRAVHHLAGGNPRLYVTFSEFLTRESLDELVPPFMEMLDDLTPYYQAKMRMLSAQQRKIVEVLSDVRGAIPVKEIALRSFITPQSVSNQLKELRARGYVQAHPIGRDSYYELQEPLMRLCLGLKNQRGEPIRRLIGFLRNWYSWNELDSHGHIHEEFIVIPNEAWNQYDNSNNLEDLTALIIEHIMRGDSNLWFVRLQQLINQYSEHGRELSLGFAMVTAIRSLSSLLLSSEERGAWYEAWRSLTSALLEFELPLRMLETAVRFINSGNPVNERILLGLPVEERTLLASLLERKANIVGLEA